MPKPFGGSGRVAMNLLNKTKTTRQLRLAKKKMEGKKSSIQTFQGNNQIIVTWKGKSDA